MFQNPLNRVVRWFRSIQWSHTDKVTAAVIGSFLAIMFAGIGCAALVNGLGANTAQTASGSASHPSTPRPTAIPSPTPGPYHH